jgi:hypothetical protein
MGHPQLLFGGWLARAMWGTRYFHLLIGELEVGDPSVVMNRDPSITRLNPAVAHKYETTHRERRHHRVHVVGHRWQ